MNTATSRIEYINSANRTVGTNENFQWSMSMSPDEQYDRVCVLFANIPISYYLVKAGSNTFQLTELTSTVTITVPAGNYSATSFINVVLPLINTASPHSWVYTMTINNNFTTVSNGLFYFGVTGNSGQPSLVFQNYLYDQFGFNANSTNVFTSNNLVSINVLNFVPETSLYIYSDLIETKDNNTTNVLQELYNDNTVNFSNITYQCTSLEGYSKKINQKKTNAFSLVLNDEFENQMSLNGRPWFITLLLYKSNDVYDIIKKYIKYNLISQ